MAGKKSSNKKSATTSNKKAPKYKISKSHKKKRG